MSPCEDCDNKKAVNEMMIPTQPNGPDHFQQERSVVYRVALLLESTLLVECRPLLAVIGSYSDQMGVLVLYENTRLGSHSSLIYFVSSISVLGCFKHFLLFIFQSEASFDTKF